MDPDVFTKVREMFGVGETLNAIFDQQFVDKDRSFDIILDIGCGPGDLTQLLASQVKHNKLLAIDFDSNQLSFAEKNNKFSSIDYLKQDFTQPWDQMSPQLNQFENKIEFIHCSGVLHWIVNKDRFLANCAKLLASNGLLFALFQLFPDLSRGVSEEFKSKTNIEWLSVGSQINYMNQLFIENGFKIVKTVIDYKPLKIDYQTFLDSKFFYNIFKLHFKCKENVEYDSLWDQLINYNCDALQNPWYKQLDSNGLNKLKYYPVKTVKRTHILVKYYCIKI